MRKSAALLLALLILSSCTSKIPSETGSLNVYFTYQDDVEQELLKLISSSNESVKCAFYHIDLWALKKLLKEKNADIVVDEDNYYGYGTEIKGSGLMHHKFCVVDKRYVFTGSLNPTFRGSRHNNNNMLIIESEYLAKNYLDEFEALKQGKKEKTKYSTIIYNGFIIENYFCPRDMCAEKVLETLKKAEHSVYFMTFSFTLEELGNYLVSRPDLDIKGVFEKRMNSKYSEYWKLLEAGLAVKEDTNKADMHHKVFIIDNKTVITGSFNPSRNADTRNDENILIMHDETIANEFLEEFERLWK